MVHCTPQLTRWMLAAMLCDTIDRTLAVLSVLWAVKWFLPMKILNMLMHALNGNMQAGQAQHTDNGRNDGGNPPGGNNGANNGGNNRGGSHGRDAYHRVKKELEDMREAERLRQVEREREQLAEQTRASSMGATIARFIHFFQTAGGVAHPILMRKAKLQRAVIGVAAIALTGGCGQQEDPRGCSFLNATTLKCTWPSSVRPRVLSK